MRCGCGDDIVFRLEVASSVDESEKVMEIMIVMTVMIVMMMNPQWREEKTLMERKAEQVVEWIYCCSNDRLIFNLYTTNTLSSTNQPTTDRPNDRTTELFQTLACQENS